MSPDGSSEYNLYFQLILLVILIFCSAFFSAAEVALLQISKLRLAHLIETGKKGAKRLEKTLENPDKLLSTILMGNNLANIGASAIATSLSINLFGNIGVGIATFIMTLVILIFGEITPKSVAVKYAEPISLAIVNIMSVLMFIFSPIVFILSAITNGLIKLFGGDVDKQPPSLTQEELKTIVNVSNEEGVLQDEEKEMIYNIFEYKELLIRDIMIQRVDISAISLDASYEEVVSMFNESKFSRLPVYEDNLDNIVGILYAKDMLFHDINNNNFEIKSFMREPFRTFEFIKISDFFKEIQENQVHIAVVYDEYGGLAGLVTLENVIESILGDIHDEYDEEDEDIEKLSENEFIVLGSTKLDEFNEVLEVNLETEDFETISGYIVGTLGHLPKKEDVIHIENISFLIEEVDITRIEKIRVNVLREKTEE